MFFDHLDTLPKLDLKGRGGGTDYIDFITWDEVTEPAMTGVDCFRRSFIVIKFIIGENTPEPKKIMQTFFQRYTDGHKWMGCGHATENLMWTIGGMEENQFNFLDKILKGETIEITSDISSLFKGQTVSLYDEKLRKAVKTIQNYWRICRYNPEYKMCERVQSRNLEITMNE